MDREQTPLRSSQGLRDNYRQPVVATPVAAPVRKKRTFKKVFKRLWLPVVITLAVAIIGFLVYGYISTKHELNRAKNASTSGKTETEQLVNQIRQYLTLPDETPTLATVSDANKLKDETFFKDAQNGDKVLIFSKAGRALLYRPSTRKVIEYAPVNLNTPPGQ